MGGTDDPSNLVELSVEEHAEAHKKLYEEYGNEYDRIAYEAPSGIIKKEFKAGVKVIVQVLIDNYIGVVVYNNSIPSVVLNANDQSSPKRSIMGTTPEVDTVTRRRDKP